MSKYLVTGGAGFIGSHISEALIRRGHFVRVLDNFSSGRRENLGGFIGKIDLLRGDIRNKNTCLKACKGIDHVLHQAALRCVPKSLRDPHKYNEVNINGTLNLLQAAHKFRVRSFVFASSSSIYGDALKFPEREIDPARLISPYALTKLSGEYYCRIFAENYGLNTVSLRYFNVFGPRQALDDEYAVVIPKFITSMLKDCRPPIYGSGRQSRDFTFVSNVVAANLLAARKASRLRGEVFNVASGRDYTILELVAILNKLMHKRISPAHLRPRPAEALRTRADLSRAKKQLGFRPKIDFVQGLKITLEWFRENA
ncbi:SDR family oxidoreductase [Candidatus Omnitrophota bacterium]